MFAYPLQKAFSQHPFFSECCSPNILAVPHLQDSVRAHLQLGLQEIHIKLIHYLKMLLSVLLIKSTFQIPAPNAQPMCSGHKLKHRVSVLYFSHFSFICCPQHAFSISRTAISDLSYHRKTVWIKSSLSLRCLALQPIAPDVTLSLDFRSYIPHRQHPPCRNRAINSCSAQPTPQHAEPFRREGKASELR